MPTNVPLLFIIFLCAGLAHSARAQQADSAAVRRLFEDAQQAFNLRQFEQAAAKSDSIIAIFERNADYAGVAQMSTTTGWLHFNQFRQYETAEQYADKALNAVETHLSGNFPYLHEIYLLKADARGRQGDLDRMLQLRLKAWGVLKAQQQQNSIFGATTLSNIAETYWDLDVPEEALEYWGHTTALMNTLATDSFNARARYYLPMEHTKLAAALLTLGRDDEAMQEAQKALHLIEEKEKEPKFWHQQTYRTLAQLHSKQGAYEKADQYFAFLEKQGVNFHGPRSYFMAGIYALQVEHSLRQKKFDAALQIAQKAVLAVCIDSVDGNLKNPQQRQKACFPCELSAFAVKSEALYRKWKETPEDQALLEACFNTCLTALDAVDDLRRTLDFRDEPRLKLLQTCSEVYRRGSVAASLLYNQTGNAYYLQQAFELAEQNKSVQLLASARAARLDLGAKLPDVLRQKEHTATLELSRQEQRIKDALDEPDTTRAAQIRNSDFLSAEHAVDDLLQDLHIQYPAWARARYQTGIPLISRVQAALHPEEALVEYVVDEKDGALLAFVVTRDHAQVSVLPWCDTLSGQVAGLLNLIRDGALAQPDRVAQFREASRDLYGRLLAPLAQALAQPTRLLIAGEDALLQLPFELLLTGESGSGLKELDYLLRQKACSYHFSGSMMAENRSLPGKAQPYEFSHAVTIPEVYQKMISEGARMALAARWDTDKNKFSKMINRCKQLADNGLPYPEALRKTQLEWLADPKSWSALMLFGG